MKYNIETNFKGFRNAAEGETWIKYLMTKTAFKEITDRYNIHELIKEVPENNTYKFEKGLIMGLFDSDGTVIGNQNEGITIRIAQTELNRLQSIQRILIKYGIFSSIYENRRDEGLKDMPDNGGRMKEYMSKALHELVISNDSTIKFREIFGFLDNDKAAKLNELINNYECKPNKTKFSSKIKKVEELGITEVYDCTIPEISHFNVNGIMSHNCSEANLEPFELCNLSKIFPAKCIEGDSTTKYGQISAKAESSFIEAVEFATFYSSTVSLLPSHCPDTNAVIARNRRIGVSISSIADVYDIIGFTELTRLCRSGYRKVREINTKLAKEAGVPASIRVTMVKPSGSISQLAIRLLKEQ